METASCEIVRLPEELLATIISLTSPPDACRASAVSRAFCTVAGSDAVWSCFVPSLPRFAEGELSNTPRATKKGMFLCLSDQPALLPCKLISMHLDKVTSCTKCYTLSAWALHISWGDALDYWAKVHLGSDEIKRKKRFTESALFLDVSWFEIRGNINTRMLSQNSLYAAYMVFKLASDGFYGLDFPFQEASVSVGGSESTRQVCLQGWLEDGDGGVPIKHILRSNFGRFLFPNNYLPHTDDVTFPQKRTDGWMEVELGDFYIGGGYEGELVVSLVEENGGYLKFGLAVWGIEIRNKQLF